MNENLDLTIILEGCPEGTKFYSVIYGECSLVEIFDNLCYPICLKAYSDKTKAENRFDVTKDGRYLHNHNGECTLFPSKDQRDWSKFERFWAKPKVEKFDPKTLKPFDKVLGFYEAEGGRELGMCVILSSSRGRQFPCRMCGYNLHQMHPL